MKKKVIVFYILLIIILFFNIIKNFAEQIYLVSHFNLDNCSHLSSLNPIQIIDNGKNFNTPQKYNMYVNSFIECKNNNIIPFIMLTYKKEIENKSLSHKEYSFWSLNNQSYSDISDKALHSLIPINNERQVDNINTNKIKSCDIFCLDYLYWLSRYNNHELGNFDTHLIN